MGISNSMSPKAPNRTTSGVRGSGVGIVGGKSAAGRESGAVGGPPRLGLCRGGGSLAPCNPVARQRRGQGGADFLIVAGEPGRVAEMDVAAAFIAGPRDELRETIGGPVLGGHDGLGADEDPRMAARRQGGGDPLVRRRVGPVFVVGVGDRDPLGAKNIKKALDLVLVGVGRAVLEEPAAAFGGQAGAMGDAGE